ncbi:MAG: Cys-Gln thioester bond-forming surface protein [Ruminococcus bicirculans]|nr:Cys-Gln thioester bond-forming surface protein [Ruminococcus bicirculans (ex Wegman et al. 2014)]
MKIKKILKRCTAAMLAAAIGMTTLAANVSAATSGISIGYIWNSSVNPTINVRKNGVTGGVSGQYIKAGEQICRFSPSSTSDWAFCIEPAKSMQGASYKDWYTQNGFTEYDTFDLTDKNKADSFAYWKSIGGTDGPMAKYLGLVQYYGYSSHKNGDYYAATQLIIWEMILGYRGHTQTTFGKCSDVLWNDFTYPSGGWCTKSGVEKAYNDIVSNVKNHYKLPSALKSTKTQAKDEPNILKYNVVNLRYETKVTVPTSYVKASSLAHNFSGLKSKLESLIKSKFSGTFGKDYGIETSTSGTNTVYTIWSKERQFTSSGDSSIYVTESIPMQMKDSLKKQETLFANSYYQTCLLSTRLDPIAGYVGLASYNEPNLTVEKTYTDSSNNQITATELNTLLGKTTFAVSCLYDGKKYYVQADKNSTGTAYVFSKYVTSINEATKFKTLKNTETKGTFTINDLPTSTSKGRTYTVTEYTVPDNERYEKLSKSVLLPSPTSDFTTNAGTKTVKMNNSETSYNAKFGTATLDKIVRNGDGKALSSDNESDIKTLSDIYKSTKFIVGYWDNGEMRYLSQGYKSAGKAFDGDLNDLDGFKDKSYSAGDGMYYMPTKLNSNHDLIFDTARTTTDISKAYVFSTGSNYSGSDTCDHFGQIFFNLVPLNSSGNAKELVFIEVNGAKGYGYEESFDAADAYMLSALKDVSSKRDICGLVRNNTGRSYTLTDESGKNYVIGAGRLYPISANKLESNRLHSDAEIVNQLVNYSLVLTKKSDSGELLPGAKYGLYNSAKKLLKTAITGTDGKAKFDYDLLPNTNYYVKEITAPDGYVLDNEYYLVNRSNTVVNDLDNFQNAKLSDYNYSVTDKPFTLKLELNKYDVLNSIPIEGITFDISLNGKVVKSVTTDKNGYAEVSGLALGKLNGDAFENVYTVTERENDKYIMLDENGELSRSFSVTTTLADIEDKTNPVITYTADIPNTLQLVDLKVHKVDEFGNPIKGVAFDIVPTQDITFNGKTVQKKGESVGTVITDEQGYASTTYTEYEADGTQGYTKTIPIYPNFEYELVEVSVPEPYVIPEKNTKLTAKSEKADTLTIPHEVTVTNDVQRGTLEVYKTDSETNTPLAGVEFEVRAAEDFFVGSAQLHKKGDVICTMTTDSTGHADTGNAQMYVGAKYTLTETKTAEGYKINKDSKIFEFNFAGNTVSYSKLNIDVGNDSQKGKISVYKLGEAFTGVTALDSAIFVDENGEIMESGQTTYTPVFTECALGGAVFQVTAAEDIVTADGTTRAKAGDVVAEITTDENGYAETELLYLGKYEVTEIKAPFGYVLDSKPKTVELTYAGQEIAVRDTVNTAFDNDYQGVRVSLSKVMENDELFGIYGKDNFTSVRFGLFAAEEITASNGTSIPAGGLISEVSLAEDMTAKFDAKLPFGKYYVQEIATDDKYILNGEKYLVTFEYMGQDIQTVDIDCGQFINSIKRGYVRGYKVNDSGEPLENAVFGLFAADTSEFTNENAIMTAVSDENGYFEFADIAYGNYIVCEIEAPAGYIFSDEKYPVSISENGAVVEIIAENKPITVEISKRDVYGNELKGAKMKLINVNGEIVDEWTSEGTNHVISELPAGAYTLKEIAAPDGYVIATDIGFTVDIYGNVTVENVESIATSENGNPLIVMVDDTTKVEISKQDITNGKELPGAMLQIIDENGNIVEEWISTNKPHFIEAELIAGKKYALHETVAPDGYVIANDVEFTVSKNGTVDIVIMQDDTTKVKISKKDITTGEELPGATLQIVDENGNVVEEWVSSSEPHFIKSVLLAGAKYTLHETVAPDGYVISNDVEFTVSENGTVDIVVMQDDTTKVKISKKDITTGEELPGATLQIIDENGNIIEEWVSTNEPHMIEGKLIAGKEYTLKETMAPEGYEIANEIKFTVNADGSVTEVILYDEHKPVPEKPETPPTDTPHTGVSADNSAAVYLISAVLLMIVGIIIRKKH